MPARPRVLPARARRIAESAQSQRLALAHARLAGRARSLGPARRRAARFPLSENRRRHVDPARAVAFPKIPDVRFPTRIQQAWHVDYGEEFRSAGIDTIEPPKVGAPFPMRVPQVDADGNETSGIRLPATAVPLATYTGWNLRAPAIGAPTSYHSMAGSFIPFARTKADRVKSGDPRLSIAERYPTRASLPRQGKIRSRQTGPIRLPPRPRRPQNPRPRPIRMVTCD